METPSPALNESKGFDSRLGYEEFSQPLNMAGILTDFDQRQLIAGILTAFLVLLLTAASGVLPWYVARKALHIGTGLLCMVAQGLGLDSLIVSVGVITFTLILTKSWKFYPMQEYALREKKASFDVGMLNFILCTVLPVSMGISLAHFSPVYFADPMGAIVGRNLKTWRIPGSGNKSVGGSLAVMLSAYLSLVVFSNSSHTDGLCWGLLIAAAEAFSGEWDNTAIASLLSIRFLILIVGPKLVLSTAVYYFLPDLTGCLLTFAASYAISRHATGPDNLGAKGEAIYAEVYTVNWGRIWIRLRSKLFAFVVLLIAQRGSQRSAYGDAIAHPSMPAMSEMFMLSVWYSAMGLVDELHDTVLEVPLHKARVRSWVFYLAYLALLVPIPVLIMAKDVFAHYAVAFSACQIMGKKLDNAVFKATVAIGLPLSAFLAWQSESGFSGWPVLGMAMVAFMHFLYEIHDEVQLVQRLIALGVPAVVFTMLCNMHFAVNTAVAGGFLPLAWLCCNSCGYPVAKAGLATGALGWAGPKISPNPKVE